MEIANSDLLNLAAHVHCKDERETGEGGRTGQVSSAQRMPAEQHKLNLHSWYIVKKMFLKGMYQKERMCKVVEGPAADRTM